MTLVAMKIFAQKMANFEYFISCESCHHVGRP